MDITRNTGQGNWLRPRLRGWGVVGGVVPRGFDAYVRILHPISGMRFDLDEAHRDEWGQLPVIDQAEFTWAQVAARTRRTMHPLVQSGSLFERNHQPADDGWRLDAAPVGHLDPDRLRVLAEMFRPATATPGDVTAAVWVGWGSLDGARASVATLELPGREYALFETTLDELADPSWTQRPGIGGNGFPPGAWLSPQLLWPADLAWCLATEIDFDSTLVGGTRELIDAILAGDSLETFEVGPDDDLTWLGDTINPAPPAP